MHKATLTRNILRTYRAATAADQREGRDWYDNAYALADRLDPTNVERAAGVIAALSPRMTWSGNVRAATAALTGETFGGLPDSVSKAHRILAGEAPLDVLGGRKVRAFYASILGDEDAVCVDMHAHDVALGRVTDDATRATLQRKAGYNAIADAYRRAAAILAREGDPIGAATLQAVTWVAWRRVHYAAAGTRTATRTARAA